MQLRSIVGTLLLALASLAPARSDTLPLAEAMRTARTQARDVLAATARITAGEARLDQARGYRWPTVRFHEMWMRTDNPAEVFAFQLNQGRFSFEDFVTSDPNNPDYLNNAISRFEMELPVYTGGELSGRIDQARAAATAARTEAEWTETQAALAAAEAYIRLDQARRNVELLTHVLDTVTTHVELASAFVDQGMIVRSELLRAEVEKSRIEDLLIEARGQARVAEANLAFRLGAPAGSTWELEPLPDPIPLDDGLDQWLASASQRADLEAARQMLTAAELEVQVQRAALLPRIGVAARYDMFSDQVFTSDHDSSAIMAMLSVDLFAGNRHRRAKAAAAADYEAGQLQIEQFTAAIGLEVRDAYERALTARERFSTASAAKQAAAEAERITSERFKEGVVKMIDLVDATTALQEAQTRVLVARAEAHLASLTLAAKAGQQPEALLLSSSTSTTRDDS